MTNTNIAENGEFKRDRQTDRQRQRDERLPLPTPSHSKKKWTDIEYHARSLVTESLVSDVLRGIVFRVIIAVVFVYAEHHHDILNINKLLSRTYITYAGCALIVIVKYL